MSLLLMRRRWLSNIQIQKTGAGMAHQAAQPPPASDLGHSILLNNLNRHHLLIASLHNLPPPHSAYPRQLASESSQAQPFCPLASSSSSQTVVWPPFPLAQALSLRRIRMVLHNHGHDPSPRHTPGLRPTILLARARGVPLWRWCLRQLLRAIDCRRAVGSHG
jgi:hypothetical protein